MRCEPGRQERSRNRKGILARRCLPSPAPADEWALQGQWWALSVPGLQTQEIRILNSLRTQQLRNGLPDFLRTQASLTSPGNHPAASLSEFTSHIPAEVRQGPSRVCFPPTRLPSALPQPSSSIHVREAHAQHTVPGQPLSPASFTPANTQPFHIRTQAPSQPHAGCIRNSVRLSVCVNEETRVQQPAVEEDAPRLQPGSVEGQQGLAGLSEESHLCS